MTVTRINSICILRDIKIWASGRYQRLQTIQKFKSAALKVVPVAFDYSDLTGKFVFWKAVCCEGRFVTRGAHTWRFNCAIIHIRNREFLIVKNAVNVSLKHFKHFEFKYVAYKSWDSALE